VNWPLVHQLLGLKSQAEDLPRLEVLVSAEADEQWSFVGHKGNQRWLWYLLEKSTRKVIAFIFGPRSHQTYRKLISLLPMKLIDHLFTDNLAAYSRIRLAPIHVISKAGTWRIERKNLDLRTRVKRLARKTICFSKNELIHDTVIGLFINYYLF